MTSSTCFSGILIFCSGIASVNITILNFSIDVGIYPDYMGFPVPVQNVTPYGNTTVDFTGLPAHRIISGTLVDCNSNAIPGHVMIVWPGGMASTYTNTGNFSLQIDIGAFSFDFSAYGNNSHYDQTIMPTANPMDLGSITLCPPPAMGPSKIWSNYTYSLFCKSWSN